MFYCDECAAGKGWPETRKEYRRCGLCEQERECSGMPSMMLPGPKGKGKGIDWGVVFGVKKEGKK